MASETSVQGFVHALEEGKWKEWVLFLLLWVACAAVWVLMIFGQFRGLSHAKAMDQAQVAREIARGHGFSTKMIRPAAIKQFVDNEGTVPENVPDTYNAPLYPLFNSVLLQFTRSSWDMTLKDIVYTSDRVLAGAAILLFFLSVIVNYFTAKRLFDRRLALLGTGLILLADVFWQFAISGLPQMMMLLLFSICCHALVRALEAREEGRNPLFWLLVVGGGFGLLALTHALTIWIFLGALIFIVFAFAPKTELRWARVLKHPALLVLAVFLVFYVPWLVRTARVSGNPFGVAIYSILFEIRGNEGNIMRSPQLDFSGINPTTFRRKIQGETIGQFAGIYGYLGRSLAAPVFFIALLHLFKRPVTGSLRWGLLLMWLLAFFGMSVIGLGGDSELQQANDLHVLFIPMFIFYGLAFLLVLWTRLTVERPEINVRLIHHAFLAAVYLVSALPFLNTLTAPSRSRVQWPPYVPPFIGILNRWVEPNEIISSDMPWAVAWYADRKSLWLPDTVNDFLSLNDNNTLGGRIVGLYLTPVSGNTGLISDIVKGDYKDWAPFVLRNVNARNFPLRAVTALPIDNECVFYSDRDRWSEKTD